VDIGYAKSEVQAFLCVTFGSIWNRCTLGLQEAVRDSHTLRVLDVDYLRYKLEAEMALLGSAICENVIYLYCNSGCGGGSTSKSVSV
jgi:hypothetical protein